MQFPEGSNTQYLSRYPVYLFVNLYAIMRLSPQPSALEGVMPISAPTVRTHLSADALFDLLRTGCADISDHRPGDRDISLTDALMSAFAMFSLKAPSLLAFDQERTEGNLQRVYGMERVPCDTSMREILDPVEPESLRPLFTHVFRALQRGKALEEMVFVEGHDLLALDGTGYFCSNQIHCESCLETSHRNGTVTLPPDVGRRPHSPRSARSDPADARADYQARWHGQKRL